MASSTNDITVTVETSSSDQWCSTRTRAAASHVATAPGQPDTVDSAGGLAATELPWRSLCVALLTHPDFYSY